MRGWARAVLGEPEAGVAEAEQALDEIKTVGRVMSRSWLLGLLADARRVAGRLDGALAAVDEAVDVMHASGERHWAAELYRLRGELLLERWPDRRDDALSWLRRAVEVAAEQGAAPLHRRAEESLARAQMFETPAG